jgi:DNA-binding CsgD family transcriptional regulator
MIRAMSTAYLLAIPGIDPARWAYALGVGRHVIGRDPTCQIRLAHATVSHVHAEIRREGECLRVRDLGSRNGTFLDDIPIQDAPLAVGQRIGVGLVRLELIDLRENERAGHTPPIPSRPGAMSAFGGDCGLSRAQLRVLHLLFMGLSEKRIAQQLDLSRHTVHSHMKSIYKQLNVHSQAELMSFFFSGARRQTIDFRVT